MTRIIGNDISEGLPKIHFQTPRPLVTLGASLILIILTATAGWGQSQAVNGTIRGRVTDQSGAAVADATVAVNNIQIGYSRSMNSGSDGYYIFPNLPLGNYTVTVKKDGFATIEHQKIILQAGTEAVIDASMRVGAVSTEVQVTAGTPIIEPTRVNLGRTIEQAEIENLPLTSRNPYNFIIFQPGVSGHPNPELGIPRTINTNGLMDRINYQMDGMVDSQSDRHGLRLFPISDTYVREVQTVANGFAPEFGGTAGNIFNVITNSGSNQYHGMFQFIHRWLDATAVPPLSAATTPKPELTDYATNAGGPVIKDKLFFFAAYEHLVRGVPLAITISPANAATLGISPNLLGSSPGKLHAQFFNVRGDWNITPRNQIFLRYNYFRNQFPINTVSTGNATSALDAWSDFKDRAHVIGTQVVSSISSSLLNEFRFSWPYRNNTHFPSTQTGPGPTIVIPSVAIFGGTNAAGDRFAEKIPNWTENITYIRGTHTFKFGMNMSKILDLQRDLTFIQYQFKDIATYLAAKLGANPFSYTTFSSRSDPTGVHYSPLFWGSYFQDSWQLKPGLLVTYGLRYDRFQPPDANPNAPFVFSRKFNTPNGDVAPRLGLAWRVNDKTVVRASSGIFFEAPPTNVWFNTLNQDGSNRTKNTSISGCNSIAACTPPAGAPAFPNAANPLTTTQSVVTVGQNFKNAYTVNANLQIAREISSNDAVTLGYILTSGRHLEFLHNINLINPSGILADGRPIFSSTVSAATRLFPQFNNISLQDVGAVSSYNALLLTYQHRLSRGMQVSASYTYSHTISDAPDVNSFEQNLPLEDPTNRRRDRGNSSVNRPQAFTVSTVLEPQVSVDNPVLKRLLNDNMFAILANLSSGDPQNITANTTLNGDSTTSSVTRPAFVGRNSVRGPAIYQVDLRYTRTFARLWERVSPQFFLEANNLFNHQNITSIFTTLNVNSAGNVISQPANFLTARSTVLENRLVQFGLAARW